MSNDKPFSQACENNKRYILDEIIQVFTCPKNVVEIGSGTGQHACYFSRHLPHIMWQPTDQLENLSGITQWVQHSLLTNLKLPLCLDVR